MLPYQNWSSYFVGVIKPVVASSRFAKSLSHFPQTFNQRNKQNKTDPISWGVLIALGIIGIWFTSTITLLTIKLDNIPLFALGLAVVWQTFLYTGLFITAHDAMHGAIAPNRQKLNHFIGSLVLILYGLFSFKELLRKHWLHHQSPASSSDPDFHNGHHPHPVLWYLQFMKNYWSWYRLIGLMIIFNLVHLLLHLPERNLTLFWVIPSILSSFQLFYCGTYLPHREPKGGYKNTLRATTLPYPPIVSFLMCYHFGYHEEHHQFPALPWWQLPKAYQDKRVIRIQNVS